MQEEGAAVDPAPSGLAVGPPWEVPTGLGTPGTEGFCGFVRGLKGCGAGSARRCSHYRCWHPFLGVFRHILSLSTSVSPVDEWGLTTHLGTSLGTDVFPNQQGNSRRSLQNTQEPPTSCSAQVGCPPYPPQCHPTAPSHWEHQRHLLHFGTG